MVRGPSSINSDVKATYDIRKGPPVTQRPFRLDDRSRWKRRIERSHKERTKQLHVPNPRLIQGLPMPRKDIEADGLTAETMRENFRLRQENELLGKECRLLAAKADGRKRPNTEMVKALLAEAERSIATGSKICGASAVHHKGVRTRRSRYESGTLCASRTTKHAISARANA